MAYVNGFILGLIGGLLDFASASLLIFDNAGSGGMMNTVGAPPYGWAIVLVLLGVAVVVTSVYSVISIGIRFAKVFSFLMVAYGVIMMIIGWLMTTGYILMASGESMIYSYGMVLVGAAMLVNGIMMTRNPMPI